MIIYGLKNCDNCRKALKAFPNAKLQDVRSEAAPSAVLEVALATFGDALVNTRSTTWRGLSETERSVPPLVLIQTHPSVMKRPLIQIEKALFLGWNAAVQTDIAAMLNEPGVD